MTTEPTEIDKSKWGDGPWQSEPDRVEWNAHGLPCLMVRHARSGHWCGYAAVSPGHPAFEKGWDDIDVRVHGGVTYTEHCEGSVCHVPAPGAPDNVWWIGFDCNHCDDLSPSAGERYYFGRGQQYREANYVKRETECLARQLAAMVTP